MRYVLLLVSSVFSLACAGHGGAASFQATNTQYGKPLLLSLPPCAQAVQVSVTDRRPDPSVIGTRYLESAPNVQYPVRMVGEDAATYVQKALTLRLKQAGANAPNTSQESLGIELRQLAIEEGVVRLSSYSAETSFQAAVMRPGSAQPCWQGQVTGKATNTGSGASAENYQETLDWTMDAAAAYLVKAPGFADALCGKCSGAGT